MKDGFREWLSDNLRYILLILAVIIGVILISLGVRLAGRLSGKNRQSEQTSQGTEGAGGSGQEEIVILSTEQLTEGQVPKAEQQTEKATEEATEKTTEKAAEKPTEQLTERPAGQQTEKAAEQLTERLAKQQTENSSEQQSETLTGNETEKPTEKRTEKATEKPTEKATEKPTEKATEKPTEKATEKPTEKATEKQTEKATEKPAETAAEKPTENTTQKITERITEKAAEPETDFEIVVVGRKPQVETEPETERETEEIDTLRRSRITKIFAQTSLNVRAAPSTEAEILGSVNNGTEFSKTGETTNWYRVVYNGRIGYISKELAGDTYTPDYRVMNGTCYLRSEADYGDNIIGEIYGGTTVEYLFNNGGWAYIRVDGQEGYIGARFLPGTGY